MKKGILATILSLTVLMCAVSCDEVLQESQYKEFELTDQDGNVRTGGVYIPQGIKPKSKYPVVFMLDGRVFKESRFKHVVDSLIENHIISPVIIACSYENKMTIPGYRMAYRNAEFIESIAKTDPELSKLFDAHYSYIKDTFIPYINSNYPVKADASQRVFFGTSNSADFGITLSMREGDLFSEYWCFSPVYSDVSEYGVLRSPVSYSICWGAKEEVGMFDYFPNLLKDIRKRGGKVNSWVFNGGHDREWWKYWFCKELERRFPYKN